jgi:predicted RNase H-like nuclease (RuvC/YqgF family)
MSDTIESLTKRIDLLLGRNRTANYDCEKALRDAARFSQRTSAQDRGHYVAFKTEAARLEKQVQSRQHRLNHLGRKLAELQNQPLI